MSNRVRPRGGRPVRSADRSYTQRLQRTRAYRPPRHLPAWAIEARWITEPAVPTLLVLLAEAGHLVAAWSEWPATAGRGVFQVVVAGLLGVAAVTMYFDPAPVQLRLGLVATLLVPACWAVGAMAGLSPYREYPGAAAGIMTAVELIAAALLGAGLLALRRPLRGR